MKKLLLTRRIPEIGVDLVNKHFVVDMNPENKVMPRDEIMKSIRDKEYLLCLLTDKIEAEVMDAAPDLKVISNYAVGYNNIDVKAATERGILVTNTPGVLTDTTADLAFSLMMAAARRIPEADKFTRAGKYEAWDPMLLLGQVVFGKTLGIVGFGRIGKAMAKRASGFDMDILYYDAYRADSDVEKEYGVKFTPLDMLLTESDFVTIHVPLMDSTHHMIGKKQLEMMKKTSVLINTSRGPVVDETALVEALKNKVIFSAGLDVYEFEPKIPDALKELDNVVLLPHIGSASFETRGKMAEMAAKNAILASQGKMPLSLVNKEVLPKSRISISEGRG